MGTFIVAILAGIACIVMGIFNMHGYIGTLKRKHRKRVAEADVLPFGRKIGLSTIIMGVALFLFGVFSAIVYFTENTVLQWVGTGILITGLAVGLPISVYAMIKYNKGIF